MNAGAVVVTNLDNGSPNGYRHLQNLIDVASCSALPTDSEVLARIGRNAIAEAKLLSWVALTDRLLESDNQVVGRLQGDRGTANPKPGSSATGHGSISTGTE